MKKVLGTRGVSILRQAHTTLQYWMSELRLATEGVAIRNRYLRLKTQKIKPTPFCDSLRILFVTEKWCDGLPEHGLSNNDHNLLGSLNACGLASCDCFHFDEYQHQHGRHADKTLLIRCMESKPDLLVLTWMPFSRSNTKLPNPNKVTINIIAHDLRIPIVAVWFESVSPHVMRLAESLSPDVTLHVVLDSPIAYRERTSTPEKYLPLWTPQDPRIYYDPHLERDINISFVGSMNMVDRKNGLAALRAGGVEVYQAGGQRQARLSPENYARVHMRSKIALNFCGTWGQRVQTKGRIFEATLCGAMLMEAANDDTPFWFRPMVDYVPFRDEKDLVDKARYYLEHEVERLTIAHNGYCKAQECYNAQAFWRTLLERALGKEL